MAYPEEIEFRSNDPVLPTKDNYTYKTLLSTLHVPIVSLSLYFCLFFL